MSTPRQEASAVIWSPRGGATDPQDSAREAAAARRQGLLGGVIGLTVAAGFYFLLHRPKAAAVIAGVALVFTLLALLSPLGAYRAVTRLLERFAHAVATAVTWALLTFLYFLVVLPLGWFLRARGRLGITRSFDPRLPSYWISLAEKTRSPDSYERQF
jgi:hypothetical protein